MSSYEVLQRRSHLPRQNLSPQIPGTYEIIMSALLCCRARVFSTSIGLLSTLNQVIAGVEMPLDALWKSVQHCATAIRRQLVLLRQARDGVRAAALRQRSLTAQIENINSMHRRKATTMKLKSHNCDRNDTKYDDMTSKVLTYSSSSSDSSEGRATSSSSSCFLLRVDIVFQGMRSGCYEVIVVVR